MAVIDLKSAYTKGLAEIDLDKNKIADWEEVLSNLQGSYKAAYETEIAPIEQQAKYDISQAYANYKKTQLNLLQNQQLGAGLREHLGSELLSSYSTTYSGIKREESSKLSSIGSTYMKQYLKDYDEQVKELEKAAGYVSKIDEAVLRYSGINSFAEAEKQGYYKQNKAGEYELTDKGKDLYSKAYLSNKVGEDGQVYGFYDYLLSEEDYGEEVADYYLANRAAVGELTAGFTAEEMGGKYDMYKYRTDIISPEKAMQQNLLNIEGIEDAYAAGVVDNADYAEYNKLLTENKKLSREASTIHGYDSFGSETAESIARRASATQQINKNKAQMEKLNEKYISQGNEYGIKATDKGILATELTQTSFGKFAGTGKGTEQDKWLETLAQAARNHQLKNGDVVDVNYGAGKKHNYIYFNGYFYKTTAKATIKDPKKTDGKIEYIDK